MRPLKALWLLFGFVTIVGCQGPDEFYRLSNDGEKTGTAGSSSPGTAGSTATGTAGTSAAGTAGTTGGRGGATGGSAGSIIISGAGGSVGTAGTTGAGGGGGSGTGTAGSTAGTAGSTGTAGSGTSRGGTTGTGAAGSTGARGGTTGTAGVIGSAGTTGSGGATATGGAAGSTSARGGTTGTAGVIGSAGTTGAGGATGTGTGGAGGRGPDRLQVVATCQDGSGAQDIRVKFKILNPESVAKQWSDIKVRYYFTLTMQLPATAKFDFLQKIPAAAVTTTVTNSYVEIGFTTAAGMIAGFDNVTGSDEMQLHLSNYTTPTWNTSQTDDYSFKACASGASTSAYTDRLTMPGYYQGQLAWGSEPAAP